MSFSDEAIPAEEVAPEPALVTDENSDDGVADSEIELEAEADPMGLLKRERDEYLVALQRTQADFENYRKRIQRMQEEQSARAASALVTKLLPVLDTLDLAQAHQTPASAGGFVVNGRHLSFGDDPQTRARCTSRSLSPRSPTRASPARPWTVIPRCGPSRTGGCGTTAATTARIPTGRR